MKERGREITASTELIEMEMKNLRSAGIAGETANTELVPGMGKRIFAMGPRKITTSLQERTFRTPVIRFLPNPDVTYFGGSREDYLNFVVPLYESSVVGDWETAKLILDKRPELIRCALCKEMGYPLHVAATVEESKVTLHFVKNLVNTMTTDEMELQNQFSNTAFWLACAVGNLKMAKIMLEKNPRLLSIRGNGGTLALSISAYNGMYSILKYLYDNYNKMTDDYWKDEDRWETLYGCLERELFDLALQIVKDYPQLASQYARDILKTLAQKPDKFNISVEKKFITRVTFSVSRFFHKEVQHEAEEVTDAQKLLKIVWGRLSRTLDFYEIEDMLSDSGNILFVAAEMGNTRFIVELLRTYPDLMVQTNEDGLTLFHIAVMHRHQDIYNLLYEIGLAMSSDICVATDKNNNCMLHLVGKSSKEMANKTSEASLLMQRELLWFKEVEKIMPQYMRELKNNDFETPYELFSKVNQDLVSKGLDWMKDCMVVTTLIITVAFAVAFTVPGAYNQETGFPIFIHETSFLVFVIADAMSLFSSTTSLLIFLSILASRQDQRDFMYSLPRKLMIGLVTLFISVATMMATFSASFFVLYHNGLKWIPIFIVVFATIPVIMFAVLQFPLLVDMFRSTYDAHYLFKPKKHMLYTTSPKLPSKYSPC